MDSRVEKRLEGFREFCLKQFGKVLPHQELFGRYYPECLQKWMEGREFLFKEPPEGALTLREKELVAIAIEIVVRKPDISYHVKKAMDEGATVKQIAEIAGICIFLGGMVTFVEAGQHALKAAEEYEKEMKKKK